jgi:hypothetical protein
MFYENISEDKVLRTVRSHRNKSIYVGVVSVNKKKKALVKRLSTAVNSARITDFDKLLKE